MQKLDDSLRGYLEIVFFRLILYFDQLLVVRSTQKLVEIHNSGRMSMALWCWWASTVNINKKYKTNQKYLKKTKFWKITKNLYFQYLKLHLFNIYSMLTVDVDQLHAALFITSKRESQYFKIYHLWKKVTKGLRNSVFESS